MHIPRLLWPLMVYEIGLCAVERIEQKIGSYTRKWLGLPPGLTSVVLYSRSAKLKLPLRSVVEEYKVSKVRSQMMLSYSSDDCVRSSKVKLKSGRKWKAAAATVEAEQDAKFKDVIGATQSGRQGFGFDQSRILWASASDRQRRIL